MMVAHITTISRFGDHIGGFFFQGTAMVTKEKEALQLMVCGLLKPIRIAPDGFLVVQLRVNANEVEVYKAHASLLEFCDNLINAFKLLANQQKDGDSRIQSFVAGLHERSRSRSFTGKDD